ncbi:MAG: UDP-N-acetylmuramoyl-tripeptide--D-alanyl-D-alanine ligase [Clostridiales bacterium]|nr:UDP-N-acetylmuramoyl-tripeptide--D-alanyl-D-alanine ligase [Clostridiales bacterium]
MIPISIAEINEVLGGRVKGRLPEGEITDIVIDSRKASEGSLFIALKGEKVDGHSFINGLEGRILAAVTEREVDSDVPQIVVDSTYKAVGRLGAYVREKSGVTVVGVTGSVGKTSVKELTAAVLSQRFSVLKTEKNHNNELGLPLTLFRLAPENEVAVLEMGISYFGEMTRVSAIARPDAAIFTNIENVHTENLIDREGVLRAKTELVANMRGDTLILNGEDDKLRGYALPEGKKAIYYGIDGENDVTASDIVYHGMESTDFVLHAGKETVSVSLPASGRHMVVNSLAAAAAGMRLGLTAEEIKRGLESYVPVDGRMSRIEFQGAAVLNDCYNASPTSMKASLQVLKKAEGRKIALLGDMFELGLRSDELHEEVGRAAAEAGLYMLVTVGENAVHIAEAAMRAGLENVVHAGRKEAASIIKNELKPGDTLLVKASRGMALEKIIAKITEE